MMRMMSIQSIKFFQPKQNKQYQKHITTYNDKIPGCEIVDRDMVQCWNMMDFVSSIVFVDVPCDGKKQCLINQLFYPRANIICIKFGSKYIQTSIYSNTLFDTYYIC